MQATAAKVGSLGCYYCKDMETSANSSGATLFSLGNTHILQNNTLVQRHKMLYMQLLYPWCTHTLLKHYPFTSVVSTSVSKCNYTPTHLFCENCQELQLACWCIFPPSYSSSSYRTKCCGRNNLFCIQLSCTFGNSLRKQLLNEEFVKIQNTEPHYRTKQLLEQ